MSTSASAMRRAARNRLAGVHLDLLGPIISQYPLTHVAAHTQLFSPGEAADRFFLLIEGKVKLSSYDASGAESILHVFEPGDFFGLPALVGLKRYPAGGETVQDSSLAILPREAVYTWLRQSPEQAESLLAILGLRYLRMVDDLAGLKSHTPHQRLCQFLLSLAEATGPLPGHGSATFDMTLPQYMIAGRIGLAPENVSRALKRLREHGIDVRRGKVAVRDITLLRCLAEGDRLPRTAPPSQSHQEISP